MSGSRACPDQDELAGIGTESIIDSLVIGFNEGDFAEYVELVRAAGVKSPFYRDLRLAFINRDGTPLRALDLLNDERRRNGESDLRLNNMDFISPAVSALVNSATGAGLTVEYVNLFQQEKDVLDRFLTSCSVRSVAITTTLYVHPDPIREIVDYVRNLSPSTKIIVGGPYINGLWTGSASPEERASILKYLKADLYIVNREGERTHAELVSRLAAGADYSSLPNLCAYDETNGLVVNELKVEDNALTCSTSELGFVRASDRTPFAATRTAKSCPFSCAFCAFPARSGAYTYLDVADVGDELARLAKTPGLESLTFIDDTFNVPRRRFDALLDMMIERQFPFKWNCFYRSDHGNESTIKRMSDAGCEGVFLGVESGSDHILGLMNKTARVRHYQKAIPLLKKYGISSYVSLIVGFPGETRETVEETLDLIREFEPDYFRTQLWYCDPSTPIWNKREELGIEGMGFNWRHATMDSETAADIIDQIFLDSEDFQSTWLPQWGFEQWSTFYLQRCGLSSEEVREFVREFNSIVRCQLRGGHETVPSVAASYEYIRNIALKLCDPRARVLSETISVVQ